MELPCKIQQDLLLNFRCNRSLPFQKMRTPVFQNHSPFNIRKFRRRIDKITQQKSREVDILKGLMDLTYRCCAQHQDLLKVLRWVYMRFIKPFKTSIFRGSLLGYPIYTLPKISAWLINRRQRKFNFWMTVKFSLYTYIPVKGNEPCF